MILVHRYTQTVAQSNIRAFSSMLAPVASQMASASCGVSQSGLAAFHSLHLHECHLKPPQSNSLRVQSVSKVTLPRDPDRPKLPLSAYLRFAAVFREKSQLKGGVETMRKTGEAWKNASEAEKKPFLDIAANEKKVYQAKFEEYKASGKLDAWKRDPAKPKRPNTAFLEYSLERRKDPQLSKMSVAESAKLIGAEWKAVPQAQKDALQAKAKSKLETYNQDMKAYKASGKEEAWLERTGRLKAVKEAEEKLLKKKTKEADAKQKGKAKEAAAKEKSKAKAAKEKEKMKLKREKEAKAKAAAKAKEQKTKEAAKKKADMEKVKEKKAKEAAKEKKEKEKAKAAAAKAKEAAKAAKLKEATAKSKDAKVAKAKEKSTVLGASKN